MLKNLIILPDGTEIYSGNARDNAIINCKYTQCVNDSTELSIGSCCCNELEIKLFAKDVTIAANDEIQYYKVDDSGTRTKMGVFRCEKPTVTGTGTYKFVAYDNVSKLDKDLTDWLSALDGWPYTVKKFANMVCESCGLSFAVAPTINADYEIREFSGSGVTGRMIMQWLGQISCSFVRANSDGEIEFAWYSDKGAEITTNGDLRLFGGSLSYEDFQVAEIQKVQIQTTDDDNGTVYPDGNEEELNTYKITGNYLLTAEAGDELKTVAQAIFEQLQGVTYTPCKASIQATTAINAGDIVHITDRNGVTITTYVMSKTNSGQKDTLECTGSYERDSSTTTNDISLKALNGKMLNISKSVDGLRVENKDTAGKVAGLELDVDSIEARVSDTEKGLSEIQLSPGQVKVTAQQKEVIGTAYSFDINDDGELVLTYEGEKPAYSINDDGELVLEYEGDTPPDTWIGEDGVLYSAEESVVQTELIGTLTSVIDGDGTWNMEFIQNGEVVSAIRFDLSLRKFVFDGEIVVGDNLKSDITEITNTTLKTTNVLAENLQVKAANIYGTLVIGSLPDGVATTDDIPSDAHITEITNETLKTTNVVAENLQVNAAHVTGTISAAILQVPRSNEVQTLLDGVTVAGNMIALKNESFNTELIIDSFNCELSFNVDDTIKATISPSSMGVVLDGFNVYRLDIGESNYYMEYGYWGTDIRVGFYGKYAFDQDVYIGTSSSSTQKIRLTKSGVEWQDGNRTVFGKMQADYTGSWYVKVDGTFKYTSGSWISSSDVKLKNTISDFKEEYDTLFDNLRPRTYKWNDGTSGRTHTGFIVQEVVDAVEKAGLTTQDFAAVVAFGATDDPDVEWGIRYDELAAINTWQIQKLKARVAELERKLYATT